MSIPALVPCPMRVWVQSGGCSYMIKLIYYDLCAHIYGRVHYLPLPLGYTLCIVSFFTNRHLMGHSSGQASHTSRKIQSERNSQVGTCEQRDTGQGHPDKGTRHRSVDYLQNHIHFCWNGSLAFKIASIF